MNANLKQGTAEVDAKSSDREFRSWKDEAGKQSARLDKKGRWPGEVKAAMKAMADRNKAKVAAGEKELPGWEQKAAARSLKEWLHEMQDQRDTLIDTRGPPEQIKTIQEAIQECVTTGRIPGYRPTRRRDAGGVTKKDDSFSSPFFSQPHRKQPF